MLRYNRFQVIAFHLEIMGKITSLVHFQMGHPIEFLGPRLPMEDFSSRVQGQADWSIALHTLMSSVWIERNGKDIEDINGFLCFLLSLFSALVSIRLSHQIDSDELLSFLFNELLGLGTTVKFLLCNLEVNGSSHGTTYRLAGKIAYIFDLTLPRSCSDQRLVHQLTYRF